MTAVYFGIGFIVALGSFITFIVIVSTRVGPHVSPRLHSVVETLIVAGIMVGTATMIQPWLAAGLQWGFVLLLAATLAFIVWSHVTPRPAPHDSAATERKA